MRRSGKRAVLAAAVVLSLVSFTACGGKQKSMEKVIVETSQETESEETQQEETQNEDQQSSLDAFAEFAGAWTAEYPSDYDGLVINEDGSWDLYENDAVTRSGELDYDSDEDSVWIYQEEDGSWCRLYIEDDGSLFISSFGYFQLGDVMKADASDLKGEWDLEESAGGNKYVLIDADGSWQFYEIESDGTIVQMDVGNIACYSNSEDVYYARSTVDSSITYRVAVFDDNTLAWGDENGYFEYLE